MTHLSKYVDLDDGPLSISEGLGYAIRFADALGPKLRGHDVDVEVSAVRDGLFFSDVARGYAVRITTNKTACCGRMYLGETSDFDHETKSPKETLMPLDWEIGELSAVVEKAVAFFDAQAVRDQAIDAVVRAKTRGSN